MNHHEAGSEIAPIGVILAGGRGTRIGGGKARATLLGRPLISYPLAALGAVLDEVVVLAKPDTPLPPLAQTTVWTEPAAPLHPAFGLLHALRLARGRAVLACGADLPLVSPELVVSLIAAARAGTSAVLATASDGRPQPLLGVYRPVCADHLREALAAEPNVALQRVVMMLGPELVQTRDDLALFNVNTPDDLVHAAALLDQPKVKS